jgi:GTP-binding protein EngB required for normal cell division
VAKRAGTTRSLHFHGLGGNRGVLIDGPGYGFAHMNERQREYWHGMVMDYLRLSSRVCKLYLCVNGEHGAQEADLAVMRKVDPLNLQWQIVLTKADKIPTGQIWRRGLALGTQLKKFEFRNLSPVLLAVSCKTGFGVHELRQSVAWSLANCLQRHIDGKEQLLLDYLDTKRVHREQLQAQHAQQARPYELKRLFYASKYSRFLQ